MNNIEEKKIIISQKINFPKKLEKSIQTIDQNLNNNNQQLTFGSYDKDIQNENYNNNYNDNNDNYKYNNNNLNEEKEINYNKEKYFFSPEKNIKNIRIEFQNNIETKKYFDTPYKANNNILNESNRFNEENSIREKLLRRKNINYLSNNNSYEEINNKRMKINNNVENFEKDILTIRIPSQNIERISYINKTPQIPNKRNNIIERITYINKTPKIDERNFNEKKYKTPQIQKINLAGSNLRYNNSGSNIFQYNNKNSDDIRQSKNYHVYSLTNIQKDNYNDLNNNNINNNVDINKIGENDGIYFLSHKFPCIDVVIKNGKNLYLIQVKKTLMFEHILKLNEDMHYFYLMEDERILKELMRQNDLKMKNNKLNTKLNFFLNLHKLHQKNFNFKFIFIYQAKESTLNVNTITDENNIKEGFITNKSEINYNLNDEWKGPIDQEEDNNKKAFYIYNKYFLKIKCKKVLNNILLTSLDNFSADIQNILKISNNANFFSTLKE